MSVAFQCRCGASVPISGNSQMHATCPSCFREWARNRWGDAFVPAEDLTGSPEPIPVAPGQCQSCAGSGLLLGGWMGPTKEAPYPRPCSCDRGAELDTPRKVQLKVMQMVDLDYEQGGGYWTAKYPRFGVLAGHLEDVERAAEEDSRLPDTLHTGPRRSMVDRVSYTDADGLYTVEYSSVKYGHDETRLPHNELSRADVVKIVDDRTGRRRVIKHRRERTPYPECGDDREPFGTCTRRDGHSGPHRDAVKDRSWT